MYEFEKGCLMGKDSTKNEVVVRDVKMSFWSMVVFMVKWSIATIPAMIILAVIAGILYRIIGALFQKVLPHSIF